MKKIFKKKQNIIKLILFIVMLYFFVILGTKNYTDTSDNIKFATEYKDISKNNIYKYVDGSDVLNTLESTGIILMGFSSNIWTHYYADYLNEIAMLNNIDVIYYYDYKRDRSLNSKNYVSILNKLRDYLTTNDDGTISANAPIVIMVKDGNIVYFNNDIDSLKGSVTPSEYFTNYQENLLKADFTLGIEKMLGEE